MSHLLLPANRRDTARRAAAFTLVELLVVIGIIAILVSILLPSLNQARRKAQAIECSSDIRQIHLAMLMFTQDNKGHLPRPYGVNMTSANPQAVKVCAWLQKVSGATGHVDFDDDKGALWKYIPGTKAREEILMCSGDTGEALAGHPRNPQYPRNSSYSLNCRIQQHPDIERGRLLLGIRISTIKQSAEKILIYEELAPNDTWCIMGMHIDDIPSGRHGLQLKGNARLQPNSRDYRFQGRGNYGFFDGHVEMLPPAALIPPKYPAGPGNPNYHAPLTERDSVGIPF